MTTLRREFERFINRHGRIVLVAHTNKKLHCDCWNPTTDEGDPECPKCFSTGWIYHFFLTQTRREEVAMKWDKLDLSDEIKAHTTSYKYFFKPNVPIYTHDFVFEFNLNTQKGIEKIIVRNDDLKTGEIDDDVYKVVLTNKISINNSKIQNYLKSILNRELKEV